MTMPHLPTLVVEVGGAWGGRPRIEAIKTESRVWKRFIMGYISIAIDVTPDNYEPTIEIPDESFLD